MATFFLKRLLLRKGLVACLIHAVLGTYSGFEIFALSFQV